MQDRQTTEKLTDLDIADLAIFFDALARYDFEDKKVDEQSVLKTDLPVSAPGRSVLGPDRKYGAEQKRS